MMMYDSLKAYGETNGHYNVPFFHEVTLPNGKKAHLGFWLGTQRKYKKRDKLASHHIELLDRLVQEGKLTQY